MKSGYIIVFCKERHLVRGKSLFLLTEQMLLNYINEDLLTTVDYNQMIAHPPFYLTFLLLIKIRLLKCSKDTAAT